LAKRASKIGLSSQYKVLHSKKLADILALSAFYRKREVSPMETAPPAQSQGLGPSPSVPFRGLLADAIRYWEPRRFVYNLVLAAVVLAWIVFSWPHFRPALALSSLPPMAVLALVANVYYCAAYLVGLSIQHSSLSAVWKRRRWGLWLIGTLFAILLANYWIADEIYPFVR
jgi:hypothetical protein